MLKPPCYTGCSPLHCRDEHIHVFLFCRSNRVKVLLAGSALPVHSPPVWIGRFVCVCMCAVLMLSQMSSSQRRSQICHLWSLHSLSVVRQSVSHPQLDRTCAARDGEAGQIYVIWQILWRDEPGPCWWFWNGPTTWFTRGLKKCTENFVFWKSQQEKSTLGSA